MRRMGLVALFVVAACGESGGKQSAEEVADTLSDVRIQAGLWEATNEVVDVTSPALPAEVLAQMKGQKTTVRNCVTPEQAAKPDANFLAAQKDSSCTYQDFAMRGGHMTGTMTCKPPGADGAMVMTLDGRYGAAEYDMAVTMKTTGMGQGQTMTMRARTTGRRVGDCT